MRRVLCIFVALVSTACANAFAGSVPQEPEDDNQEYLLDIVTNDHSRWWRETWDAGDNRFRFRLGSNKVTQWFLEEELKFSAPLLDRVRFRFHHARLFHYTTEQIAWDVLEFEGRVHDEFYLSFYARPTFDKREGAIGLMAQRRTDVHRFIIVSVEWPDFMRNYFEHHRDTSDSLLNVFTDRPVRFGLNVREQVLPNLWVRAFGEYIPSFEMGEEVNATGEQIPIEKADARALSGWFEYVTDPSKDVRDQMAFGVEAGYQRSKKSCACASWDVSAEPVSRRDESLWALPQIHFDRDLYERTADDTVRAWRDSRAFVSPYAWVPLGERVVLNAAFRYETREIAVSNDVLDTYYTTNEYIVPRIGVSYAMGSRRQYLWEGGLVSEFRTRTVERVEGSLPRVVLRENDFDDHRLYVAFEYVFGESNVIRLNEGFELDAEDRGQFGIHDHGFFQLIIGF